MIIIQTVCSIEVWQSWFDQQDVSFDFRFNSASASPPCLPNPRREFSSICKKKCPISSAPSKLRRIDFTCEGCANHLSPSSMFLHQTSVEIEKMSPDCLRSLRTWMSSHWNVNVVVHKTRGQYFLFISLKRSPKGGASKGRIWENRGFLR